MRADDEPLLLEGDSRRIEQGQPPPQLAPRPKQPDPSCCDRRATILACFFAIGAGSTVTFNSVIMAVAYFKELLGDGVLAKLALAHNITLLATMGSLIILLPRLPRLRILRMCMRCAFALAAIVNLVVLHATALRRPLSSSVLLASIGLNGAAVGLAQGLGASLGGLFDPYSLAAGCGGMQLSGAGFGVLLPTLLQLAMLPFEARMAGGELKDAARLGALVSCGMGALVCLVALGCVEMLPRTRVWREVDAINAADPLRPPRPPPSAPACRNPEVDSIGKCIAVGSNAVLRTRLKQLSGVMAAQLLNEFSFVALLLAAPALPAANSTRAFVGEFLPTILLIVANIGSFSGRIGATVASLGNPAAAKLLGRRCRALLLAALTLCTPAIAALAHAYGRSAHATNHAVAAEWIALAFALAATVSGFALVSLGQLSQRLCNHSWETPCELTAQFIWLSINMGALGGTVLSIVLANRPGGLFGGG